MVKRVLLIPLTATAVYLLHSLFFATWIVDDAGISFVYARNLAAGHGLVSQPGLPPIEGYSNPLWVLLLVPAFLLRLFDPTVTPKILSLVLIAASFFLLDASLRRLLQRPGGHRAVSWVTLLLLAVNTPFVVWTCSGLENPLYVFLFCLLLWICVREREDSQKGWVPSSGFAVAAGLTAAGIALTRPEGIVFTVLYPLLSLTAARFWAFRRLLPYALAFGLPFAAHFAFRVLYFGDVVPNTYYAKGEMSLRDLLDVLTLQPARALKLLDLMRSLAGPAGAIVLILLGLATAYLIGKKRFRWEHGALLAFAALPAFVFLLLPDDWMAEYRMATPFFPFVYAYTALFVVTLGEAWLPTPERRRFPALLGGVAAVGLSLLLFTGRSIEFAFAPTIPFDDVVYYFGDRYNRYAEELGAQDASILLPDLGGILYVSNLRVYDLAGLCDRTIAKTRGRDQQAFYDYVFGEAKPTFLRTYFGWSILSQLERDPRFQRDYVPLFAFIEPEVRAKTGRNFASGEFVRREVAEKRPEVIRAIRKELEEDYRRELAIRLNRHREPGPGIKPGGAGPIPPPEIARKILAGERPLP